MVRGSVASRMAKGPRFEYRMRLDRMSAKEIDLLARSVTESHRRQAIARSNQRVISKLPTTERLTRESVRVLAQFPIQYRTSKNDFKAAKAGNLSSGGLLMTCTEALVEGMPVELRFTLPGDVLKIYPEEDARDRPSLGNGEKLALRSAPPLRGDGSRRARRDAIAGRERNHRYGLAFTSIDGFQQEEIARYTHAAQRSKNRHH